MQRKLRNLSRLAPLTPDPPDLNQTGSTVCKKCAELLERIERFRKVVKDKDAYISDMNDFIDKVRRVLGEQTAVLTPHATTRPARRCKL
jgi:hypothetical protein